MSLVSAETLEIRHNHTCIFTFRAHPNSVRAMEYRHILSSTWPMEARLREVNLSKDRLSTTSEQTMQCLHPRMGCMRWD